MRRARSCLIVAAVSVSACTTSAIAPPHSGSSSPPPESEPSTIAAPIQIAQEPVRAALQTLLQSKPLVDSQTDWIDARVLLNQKSIVQEPKRIVTVPFKAAQCEIKKVATQVTDRVKVGVETFSCLLKPWEWGHCTRDVFKDVVRTVWKEVNECTPEQAEVVQTVMEPVVRLNEAIMPTQVQLHYKLELEHLDIGMTGTELAVDPRIHATIVADLRAGFLTPELTVRGALRCEAELEPRAKADIGLTKPPNDIGVSVDVKSVDLDIHQLCIPGAVQGVDLLLLANPIDRIIAHELSDSLNNTLADELQKQLNKATPNIHLADGLRAAVAPLENPLPLQNDIWIVPNIRSLALSQLVGGTEAGVPTFTITSSVSAKPELVYGPKPASPPPVPLSVSLGASGDRFRLVPVGTVPLAEASAKIDGAFNNFLAKAPPAYRKIDHTTQVYQSGDRIVFQIELRKRSLFGGKAIVYLSGHPEFDQAVSELAVRDLTFDVSSRNVLVKFAAWLLHARVEQTLSDKAHFSANDLFDRALKQFGNFQINTTTGNLSGQLSDIKLGQLWIADDALNFTVVAQGTSRFDARFISGRP
jgi:hypothetical protein